MSLTGHRQIDHTADLALELWAPSQEELLAEAARAVTSVMTEGARIEGSQSRAVGIEAVDDADRLVQWVNEIIYLAVTEGFLVAECDVALHNGGLRAELRGRAGAADQLTGELKAATYHDLALDSSADGWRARLVIDV